MSIASSKFLIYSDVATTRETPPMSLTSDAAPAVMERPKAVPPPREKFSTEIWNLPNSLTLFRIFLVPILVVVLLTKYSNGLGLAIFLVELGLARAWMVVIIIGREFAVSGLRAIAAQQGVTIAASPLGKTKMISQVIAISLLIISYELGEFRFTSELALWMVVLFSLVSGVDYFLKFARSVLRDEP